VVLLPLQMLGEVAAAIPPAETGSTDTRAGVDIAEEQVPLVTIAR